MHINKIVVDDNEPDECFTVALAERPSGEGRHLIIQIPSYEPDDQDAELGLDTYCLMDENGATHYGGIEEARLAGSTLHLALGQEAANDLDLATTDLSLHLNVPADDISLLATGLRRALNYGNPDQRPRRIELD
jgi:hypothetical protein